MQTVRHVLQDAKMTVIPQSRHSFLDALALYASRPDKHYSLTDCIAMQTMRREGLTEVLTNDHHFQQEGFTILFPYSPARVPGVFRPRFLTQIT